MGDLLSAAGLLVGVVGLLYGVWYPEIARAESINTHQLNPKDAKKERDLIGYALWHRAAPLAAAAWLLTVVLAPDVLKIAGESISAVFTREPNTHLDYDAVRACLILVEVFALALAINLSRATLRLALSRQKLMLPESSA